MLKLGKTAANLDVEERRDRRRRVVLARAMVEVPGLEPFRAHVVDVSPTGMGLQSQVPMSVGQKVKISLKLPTTDDAGEIHLSGDVCYCKQQAERHFRIGLQLTQVDGAMQDYIDAFFS